MAIEPKCDKCKKELQEFGAILLSPPRNDATVKKFHLCRDCYDLILKQIDPKRVTRTAPSAGWNSSK